MLWRTHTFINLKHFERTQNLAFVLTYTFRMKSTESFKHEAPGDDRQLLMVHHNKMPELTIVLPIIHLLYKTCSFQINSIIVPVKKM